DRHGLPGGVCLRSGRMAGCIQRRHCHLCRWRGASRNVSAAAGCAGKWCRVAPARAPAGLLADRTVGRRSPGVDIMMRAILRLPAGTRFDTLTTEQQVAISSVFAQFVLPMPGTMAAEGYEL